MGEKLLSMTEFEPRLPDFVDEVIALAKACAKVGSREFPSHEEIRG